MKKVVRKVVVIVFISLAAIFAIIALLFLCVKGVFWITEKDDNSFRNDAFGIAASKLFPDISTLPTGSETELCYHKEIMHESYRLTLQFDEKQTFTSYCESVDADISGQADMFVLSQMEFYRIPVQSPDERPYTNFYIVVDSGRQELTYFLSLIHI